MGGRGRHRNGEGQGRENRNVGEGGEGIEMEKVRGERIEMWEREGKA